MGFLYSILLFGLVNLLLIGIDLISFFSVVRLLHLHCQSQWLDAFDVVGEPLVDWHLSVMQRLCGNKASGYSPQALLIAGLMIVFLCRICVVLIFNVIL